VLSGACSKSNGAYLTWLASSGAAVEVINRVIVRFISEIHYDLHELVSLRSSMQVHKDELDAQMVLLAEMLTDTDERMPC
jgi:hypothetical protein